MRMLSHVSELPCLTLPIRLVCPLADGKQQNKIAAVGSTKRLRWSHNDILRLVRYLSSGVLPSRQSIMLGTVLAHLLRRCTRLLMVLPSRQQSACDFYFYHGLDG